MYTLGRSVTHCAFCGASYEGQQSWPRHCPRCHETTWANPLPVGVALLPVADDDGTNALVIVRRTIAPGHGKRALPGGYIEIGETWQDAVVRELREETGIVQEATDVTLFCVGNGGGTIQLFGLLPAVSRADLPPSRPTEESDGWLLLAGPEELVFDTHTDAVVEYFAS